MAKVVDKSDVDVVIYHANCPDGFGAAYAAWKALGDAPEYISARHGSDPPDVAGKSVVICDFSYKLPVIKQIMEDAKALMIIDHHKSTQLELGEHVDGDHMIMDLSHSGAVLTWQYFHPDTPVPRFLVHVEDRDIWRWSLPESRDFCAGLDILPMEFPVWDALADDSALAKCIDEGRVVNKYNALLRERRAKDSDVRAFAGYSNVAVINATHDVSAMGNLLAQDTDFALLWNWDHAAQACKVSMRAVRDDVDVSEIARRYGGGGHPKASGFQWKGPIETLFIDTAGDSNPKRARTE